MNLSSYKLTTAPYGLDDCWVWQGVRTSAGYGSIKHILAHRCAWEQAHGRKIPSGRVVRHKCDNRACINPNHLVLGTQRDNVMDMVKHGRHGNSIKSAVSCRRGHPRTLENTQIVHRKDRTTPERRCRVCRRKAFHPYNVVADNATRL